MHSKWPKSWHVSKRLSILITIANGIHSTNNKKIEAKSIVFSISIVLFHIGQCFRINLNEQNITHRSDSSTWMEFSRFHRSIVAKSRKMWWHLCWLWFGNYGNDCFQCNSQNCTIQFHCGLRTANFSHSIDATSISVTWCHALFSFSWKKKVLHLKIKRQTICCCRLFLAVWLCVRVWACVPWLSYAFLRYFMLCSVFFPSTFHVFIIKLNNFITSWCIHTPTHVFMKTRWCYNMKKSIKTINFSIVAD